MNRTFTYMITDGQLATTQKMRRFTYENYEVHGKQAVPSARATTICITTHSHFVLKIKRNGKKNHID